MFSFDAVTVFFGPKLDLVIFAEITYLNPRYLYTNESV